MGEGGSEHGEGGEHGGVRGGFIDLIYNERPGSNHELIGQ